MLGLMDLLQAAESTTPMFLKQVDNWKITAKSNIEFIQEKQKETGNGGRLIDFHTQKWCAKYHRL